MQGIKVSLPGYDVTTATPEQCSIHSAFNTPKIDATRDNFIVFPIFFTHEPPDPAGALGTRDTLIYSDEHGYDYIPEIWTHADYTAKFGSTLVSQFGPGDVYLGGATANDSTYLRVMADETKYYFTISKTSGVLVTDVLHIAGFRLTLRMYIFADRLLT